MFYNFARVHQTPRDNAGDGSRWIRSRLEHRGHRSSAGGCMNMAFVPIVLIGWPAMLGSLCLMAWSIAEYRPRTAVAAALLGTPFLLYFSMSERFRYIGPLVLCAYYAVPVAIAHRRRVTAIVCASPFVSSVLIAGWLAARSWAHSPN
jgi:hypothetical protein